MKRETKSLGDTASPRGFSLFVRFLVLSTAFLVFVGATITTTGSGLAVPDWPLSFGKINPAMIGGVYYEHGHRLVASFVGLLVVIATVWAFVIRAHPLIRRLCLLSLGLVVFQGFLGGLTVLMRLPTAVSVAHGVVAQIFFCTLIALLWWTSRPYLEARSILGGAASANLKIATIAMTSLVFVQLVVAATMRHLGAGLVIPDFPRSLGRWIPPLQTPEIAISFAHRLLAVAIVAMACLLFLRIWRQHRQQPALMGLGATLLGLVGLQVALGAQTVWSARELLPTSLHVVNGALVLGVAFSLVMWAYRLSRTGEESIPQAASLEEPCSSWTDVKSEDWKELAKLRLVTMSVFTALCGYFIGNGSASMMGFFVVLFGVGLLGAGSAMLNHVVEAETDALMERTKNRPIPTGRVDVVLVEWVGALAVTLGSLLLGFWEPWAGLLAFTAFFSYVLLYTPMKKVSPSCTVVGAIPGALPVLIGYVVKTGRIDLAGAILFAILFLWQLPHFMAIAWLCKDDYAQAGLPMVTVVDPSGRLASSQIIIYCLALIPVSLAPALLGMTGPVYFYFALVLGFAYLYAGVLLCWQRTARQARRLLLTSVAYLPLLYGVMVVGR